VAKSEIIELGGNKYSAVALRSVTEQMAVSALRHKYDPNQIRNAWKQANGKSIRNHSDKSGKTTAKKTRAKKSNSKNK
jgi:hypothetical protein